MVDEAITSSPNSFPGPPSDRPGWGGLTFSQCSIFAKLDLALQSHPFYPTCLYSLRAKYHREQYFSVFKKFIWKQFQTQRNMARVSTVQRTPVYSG